MPHICKTHKMWPKRCKFYLGTARSFRIKQKKENKLFININNYLSMNVRLKILEKDSKDN